MKMSAVIFSEAYDNSLNALTYNRPLASLAFGGRYRLIDFVLSNIVNAGISYVGVITERNYSSLMDHLGSCQEWDLDRKNSGLYFLTPFASSTITYYRGKIDQLCAAIEFLESRNSDVIILADPATVCNINFRDVLDSHVKSGADITIVADRAKRAKNEIYKLVLDENPDGTPSAIYVDYAPKAKQLESMDIYLINRDVLIEKVRSLSARGLYHLEHDLLQRSFNHNELKFNIYEFTDVVLRNNTIEHFMKNNLLLTDDTVRKSIFKKERPIYTRVRDEVPTYYGENSTVINCSVADGCIINGYAENSVISRNIRIAKGAVVKNSVIMKDCIIESGAYIENAIIDKNVTISGDTKLIGTKTRPMIYGKGYSI